MLRDHATINAPPSGVCARVSPRRRGLSRRHLGASPGEFRHQFFSHVDRLRPRQPLHRLQGRQLVDESSAIGYDTIDRIPYIALSTWSAALFEVQAFDRVLERHRDAPAIILDVRMNSGGDDNRAYRVAGRFTASPRVGARYQFRNGPLHNAFPP